MTSPQAILTGAVLIAAAVILSNGAPTVAWPQHPSGGLKLDDVTFRDRDDPELYQSPRAPQNFPMAVSAGASGRYMVVAGVDAAYELDTKTGAVRGCRIFDPDTMAVKCGPWVSP